MYRYCTKKSLGITFDYPTIVLLHTTTIPFQFATSYKRLSNVRNSRDIKMVYVFTNTLRVEQHELFIHLGLPRITLTESCLTSAPTLQVRKLIFPSSAF